MDDCRRGPVIRVRQRTIAAPHQQARTAREGRRPVAGALQVTPGNESPGSDPANQRRTVLLQDPAIGGAALEIVSEVRRLWLAVEEQRIVQAGEGGLTDRAAPELAILRPYEP